MSIVNLLAKIKAKKSLFIDTKNNSEYEINSSRSVSTNRSEVIFFEDNYDGD